jgi:hypothetical protein
MKLSEEFLKSWDISAEDLGVSSSSYNPRLRVIRESSSSYSFSMILNPTRETRPVTKRDTESCMLCDSLEQSQVNRKRILMETENFILTPNKFPTLRGSSIAYLKYSGKKSRPMYRTNNLEGLEDYLEEYFKIARTTGLRMFHNSPGAGASIPIHEHSNFHNFSRFYDELGLVYGFDGAEYEKIKGVSGIGKLVNFPFANLVFEEDPERIVSFLRKLQYSIGNQFGENGVPHGLAQGKHGVLFVPAKVYLEGKGTGSGDMAGHLITSSDQEFLEADYNYGINRLGKTLFKKDEINLDKFL